MTRLSEKAVLVRFSLSVWSGFKYDQRVSEDAQKANNAQKGSGNFNKRLLPKGATAEIDKVVTNARNYVKSVTLPWYDGVDILPASNYLKLAEQMNVYKQLFHTAVANFIADYENKYMPAAQERLGKMFRLSDYPTPAKLATMFAWQLDFQPFPDAQDFRVTGMEDAEVEAMKASLETNMGGVYKAALNQVTDRIVEVVGHMKERLEVYKPGSAKNRATGIFHASMVDNIKELAEILPSLNINNDSAFAKIIDTMVNDLCEYDSEDLRASSDLRRKVAASADAVLEAVSDFIA